MKVVFDEHISHHVVSLLAKSGAPGELQHTRKAGWNNVADSVWMPLAIKNGFAIITADRNERTRRITAAEFRQMGARVVLLGPFWDHMLIWEKTKWLVGHWDQLHSHLATAPEGYCTIINRLGRIKDA